MFRTKLNEDVSLTIFSFLSAKDKINAARTNKEDIGFLSMQNFWQQNLHIDFGFYAPPKINAKDYYLEVRKLHDYIVVIELARDLGVDFFKCPIPHLTKQLISFPCSLHEGKWKTILTELAISCEIATEKIAAILNIENYQRISQSFLKMFAMIFSNVGLFTDANVLAGALFSLCESQDAAGIAKVNLMSEKILKESGIEDNKALPKDKNNVFLSHTPQSIDDIKMIMRIIHGIIRVNALILLDTLLARHANLINCDLTSRFHYSLLHLAIAAGNLAMVQILIDKGANVNCHRGAALKQTYDIYSGMKGLLFNKKAYTISPLFDAICQIDQVSKLNDEMHLDNMGKIIDLLIQYKADVSALCRVEEMDCNIDNKYIRETPLTRCVEAINAFNAYLSDLPPDQKIKKAIAILQSIVDHANSKDNEVGCEKILKSRI